MIVVEEKAQSRNDCQCTIKTVDPKSAENTKLVNNASTEKKIFIFTPEQDCLLRSLKAEKKSWKEISAKLGIPKHALHDRYKELLKENYRSTVERPDTEKEAAVMSGALPALESRIDEKK